VSCLIDVLIFDLLRRFANTYIDVTVNIQWNGNKTMVVGKNFLTINGINVTANAIEMKENADTTGMPSLKFSVLNETSTSEWASGRVGPSESFDLGE